MKINLNKLEIKNTEKNRFPKYTKLQDFYVNTQNPHFDKIEAIFKNIEKRLIKLIEKHSSSYIFGCVAWLTSEPILKALSQCKNVQIIVQKEDFLRPDITDNDNNYLKKIKKLYKNLQFIDPRDLLKQPISLLSMGNDDCNYDVDSIRCLGNYNSDKSPAFPRAHNKFLVFCDVNRKKYHEDISPCQIGSHYSPIAVWTGSFNFTKNATFSFENALYLEDKSGKNPIINAYLMEHHQLYTLSEPLNWESEWCEPEHYVGRQYVS